MRKTLKKIITPFFIAIAIPIVILEELFWPPVAWLVTRLSRFSPISSAEAWISRQAVGMILILLVVPFVGFYYLEYLSLKYAATTNAAVGTTVCLALKIIGSGYNIRLWMLTRDRLLQIEWFAWCYGKIIWVKELIRTSLLHVPGWRGFLDALSSFKAAVVRFRDRLKKRGWIGSRFIAALRKNRVKSPVE